MVLQRQRRGRYRHRFGPPRLVHHLARHSERDLPSLPRPRHHTRFRDAGRGRPRLLFRRFRGGRIASLSLPWGEATSGGDLGGYQPRLAPRPGRGRQRDARRCLTAAGRRPIGWTPGRWCIRRSSSSPAPGRFAGRTLRIETLAPAPRSISPFTGLKLTAWECQDFEVVTVNPKCSFN